MSSYHDNNNDYGDPSSTVSTPTTVRGTSKTCYIVHITGGRIKDCPCMYYDDDPCMATPYHRNFNLLVFIVSCNAGLEFDYKEALVVGGNVLRMVATKRGVQWYNHDPDELECGISAALPAKTIDSIDECTHGTCKIHDEDRDEDVEVEYRLIACN
jgi:hypothetical protein